MYMYVCMYVRMYVCMLVAVLVFRNVVVIQKRSFGGFILGYEWGRKQAHDK